MPIVFIVLFVLFCLSFPQFSRFTIVAPILAFTFGGFFWALGGIFDLASFSLGSFFLYVILAYFVVIFFTRESA